MSSKLKKLINPIVLNISANLISFVVTFTISFYVTPYVTQNVGMEAYGLVGLANNFTSYITIITAAVNSMASRFIILQLHKNNIEKANLYFNSVLFANIIFAMLSMLCCAVLIPNLSNVLNISEKLIPDAKATFFYVFLSFSVGMIFSVFSVGYYTTNKLYIGVFRTIQSDLIRIVLLVITFNFIGVKTQYTVLAAFLASMVSSVYAVRFTRKNIADLCINIRFAKARACLEMIKGGIWNSILRLSQVLLNGLDLIITNLYIGGSILGNVSVAKTFANIIITIIASVSDTFLPKFLKAYAKDEKALMEEFYKSTKILGFFSSIMIAMFISYCGEFYQCWLPGEDWVLLKGLSVVSVATVAISGPVYSMFSLYTVVNKVRPQALSTLVMSVLSMGTVFLLLKSTSLGVYAIVGTSAVYGAIKNLTYNMFCLKKYIGLDVKKCYVIILRNLLTVSAIVFCTHWIKGLFEIKGFSTLIANGLIGGVVSFIVYFLIGVSLHDKKSLLCTVSNRLRRVKRK